MPVSLCEIASILGLLLTHPKKLCTLIRLYITAQQERRTTDWDRKSMRRCWKLFHMTSRGYSPLVNLFGADLARTICILYLVLRALDTIEDDVTLPDGVKQSILRSFHTKTVTPGWHFTGSCPNEQDRQLLTEYACVVEEVNLLKPEYRDIILDVCSKMEVGMADYAHITATTGQIYLSTIAEYDLYCHYAVGLLSESMAAIWTVSGREAPSLCEELELSNSVAFLFQKADIICDIREDTDGRRFFWPREIWEKHGFKELTELYEKENLECATWVQSEMILDALRHACDALDYLKLLRNQTVFVASATVSCMAMATLALCFMNPEMFQRDILVGKAEVARLVLRSTNLRDVAFVFREYARKIHSKAKPDDPSFLRLSVMCCRIEEWYERNCPSFVIPGRRGVTYDPRDKRAAIVELEEQRAREKRSSNGKAVASTSTAVSWKLLTNVGGAIVVAALASAGYMFM